MGPRVVIIGGGIGGLTTALALARKGLRAEVYEQAPELNEVGAGVGLWGNAIRALEPLGIAGEVSTLAGRAVGSGVRRPDGSWLLYLPKEVIEQRWGSGFASVHRAQLQHLLASQLDPSSIHLGARCNGFEVRDGAVAARFSDGREIEADVLIGADGVHSVVRSDLAAPARLAYRGYTVVRGLTTPGAVPLPADAWETWGQGARFGSAPTSGERVIWYATWNAPVGTKDDGHTKARLLDLFGSWHEPIRRVIETTDDLSVRNDIFDSWPMRTWIGERVALVGDAAHPMTPDLGQGACQAIVDATTVASCLAENSDIAAAMRAYQRRRTANATLATLMARSFGFVGQLEGRLTCKVRDVALRSIPLALQLRQLDLVVGRAKIKPAARL